MGSYSNYGNNGKKKTGLIIGIIVGAVFFALFDVVLFAKILNNNNISSAVSKSVGKRTETEGKKDSSNGKKNERLTVDNEYATATGGVSFDFTIDEFIDLYNQNVYELAKEEHSDAGYEYIEAFVIMNQISLSEFEVVGNSNGKSYIYAYQTYRGEALFTISCEPNSEKIFQVTYLVSAHLYDSGNESTNDHWLREVPYYIFSPFYDGDKKLKEARKEMIIYDNGIMYENFKTELSGIPYFRLAMTACTKDIFNEYYNRNMN